MERFAIYEDNGGGVHLVVYNSDGEPIYIHTHYEQWGHAPDQLLKDTMILVKADQDHKQLEPIVYYWEGCEEGDLQQMADEFNSLCAVVADQDGIYYPAIIGYAAKLLHITDNMLEFERLTWTEYLERLTRCDINNIYITEEGDICLFVSWDQASKILGHDHTGTPDDDEKILRYFNVKPSLVETGMIDEEGLYYPVNKAIFEHNG